MSCARGNPPFGYWGNHQDSTISARKPRVACDARGYNRHEPGSFRGPQILPNDLLEPLGRDRLQELKSACKVDRYVLMSWLGKELLSLRLTTLFRASTNRPVRFESWIGSSGVDVLTVGTQEKRTPLIPPDPNRVTPPPLPTYPHTPPAGQTPASVVSTKPRERYGDPSYRVLSKLFFCCCPQEIGDVIQ